MKEEFDWTEDEMETLSDAMFAARKAFDNYINNELSLDGAYFDLKLIGYTKDSDFVPDKQIVMDFNYERQESD